MLMKVKIHVIKLLILLGFAIVIAGCSKQKTNQTEAELFEKANQALATNSYQQAVDIYQQILKDYPNSPKTDKALFMVGYIKSDNLNDKQGAIAYFQKILDSFPNSDLSDDASFMIKAAKSNLDPLSAFQKKSGQ
jgi:outer membrane protein assembly factor BamD (BamD/ComL family)